MEKPDLSMLWEQSQAALKKYWYVPGALILLILLFLAGSWYGQSKATGSKAAGGRRILHYVDPMNPAHTSPEPGLAPCGMKMEPVYADAGGQAPPPGLPPGTVKITPEKQQIIGVRVAEVEKSPGTHILRTVGKVAADETRIYRVNAISEGWILRVYDNSTGSLVKKDEPLATFYSNRADLPAALLSYFVAVDAVKNMKPEQQGGSQGLADFLTSQKLSAEVTLRNIGISTLQLRELARTRQLTQEIFINAPVTGFVLARKVSPGQTFKSGEELYRLADLSRVWILADVFENEAKYIHPGEKVKVRFSNQEETHLATVTEILPEFDPATLTLKVRLEIDNPEFVLRPGMFMDVEFPIKMPAAINIPADAILDSGLKKLVFVDRGQGYFEPRPVKTGWRLGDRVQILEGLKPGERIVVSGNFLIDSESRMKLAAAGFFGNVVKDPVCGMNLDEGKAKTAGRKSVYQGQTAYFCSDACKKQFDLTPERYLAKSGAAPSHQSQVASKDHPHSPPASGSHTVKSEPAHGHKPMVVSKAPPPTPPASHGGVVSQPAGSGAKKVFDPICGMLVQPETAKQEGNTLEYQGKTYYFCADACKEQFQKAPGHFLAKSQAAASQEQPPIFRPQKELPPELHHGAHTPQAKAKAPGTKDPVCSLAVQPEAAQKGALTSEYQGKTYYFCTPGCKQRFDQDPQHYLSENAKAGFTPPVPLQMKSRSLMDPRTLGRFRDKLMRTRTKWPQDGKPPLSQEAKETPQGAVPALPQGQTPAKPPGQAPMMSHGHSPAKTQGQTTARPQIQVPAVPYRQPSTLPPKSLKAMPPGATPAVPQRVTPPTSAGVSQATPLRIPQVRPWNEPEPTPPSPSPQSATPHGGEKHHD